MASKGEDDESDIENRCSTPSSKLLPPDMADECAPSSPTAQNKLLIEAENSSNNYTNAPERSKVEANDYVNANLA